MSDNLLIDIMYSNKEYSKVSDHCNEIPDQPETGKKLQKLGIVRGSDGTPAAVAQRGESEFRESTAVHLVEHAPEPSPL